ncbi:conjugative transposon protein TraN [Rufibacter sp. XAAS-G3-1]|uniref:conjugative transposon protein TraN n=1 Tax=Rufibacter sp. XAAS-G3-1 TaxID=2729134 RepID=UPI0015E6F36C|nr:conjugative transposon protein TraN [Rufibacter sp. XAAS-G3-1]
MKKLLTLFVLMAANLTAFSQTSDTRNVKVIYVNELVTTHIVSPEPIKYVDISTDDIAGDIPVDNIFRIKPKKANPKTGMVTIVGERFMVQYKLLYTESATANYEVRIDPTQVDEFLNPSVSMSLLDMDKFSMMAVQNKPRVNAVSTRNQKMSITLNNIYTIGDYFFVDVSMRNETNIKYEIDQIKFKIEDKKVVKATNFQQIEIEPVRQLYNIKSFQKKYRNVFVFKRFTFPDEKVFNIEIAESQISGRTISLKIDYSDVLNADTL